MGDRRQELRFQNGTLHRSVRLGGLLQLQVQDSTYQLIRLSNEADDSYQLLPAWYYVAEGNEESKPYYFPSAYVVINAIDGSIYNNELGYIYQHRNKSD